jgi:hypothetical protein
LKIEVANPETKLFEASRSCAQVVKDLTKLYDVSDETMKWELEGAIAALLTAKSRLSRASFSLLNAINEP